MKRILFISALVLLIPLATQAWGELTIVSVRETGAKGDDQANDTEAFQRAIRFSRERKIPVYIPRGDYVISETLTLKEQLMTGLEAGGWNADAMPMPRLRIKHFAKPAIRMEDASSIHGLAIVYDRKADQPRYGPSVEMAGNGLSLTNLRIQYPDDAIMADGKTNVGRTNLENIFIVQPHGVGVYLTRTYDIATVRNVEVWCNGPMQPGPAFRFGRNDELRVAHCFALNTQVGYEFIDDPTLKEERKGTYGTFTDCATDACSRGYVIKGWASLNVNGGDFWNHHDGFDINNPEAFIRITGADLCSNGAPSIHIRQAKSVIVTGCYIRRAFSNPNITSVVFEKVGSLSLTGCHFAPMGPVIHLKKGVQRAVIQGNIFEPSDFPKIKNDTGPDSQVVVQGNLGA